MRGDGISIRRLLPGDAESLVACVRRVYGAGYPQEDLYDAAALVRRNQDGDWISIVAVDEGMRVVAHLCVEPCRFGPIAETGMGMVLAEHRRHGILERLRDAAIEEASRLGLRGFYSEVGTDNAAVQGLSNRSTIFPCGISLGVWPRSMDPGSLGRQSFIRYFRYLRGPLPVRAHAPPEHRGILARIYEAMGVPISFEGPAPPRGESRVVVDRRPRWQTTFATATDIGPETSRQIEAAHRAVQGDADMESAYLELPLAQPGCEEACSRAEELGYFFAGVTPFGAREGDALRLQWRRGSPPVSEPGVAHPLARELVDYIARAAASRGGFAPAPRRATLGGS